MWQALETKARFMELTALRDQLKAALSITTPDPAAKPLPPAYELAEQIKALKAAHTIEAAPQRLMARSPARAEEPTAARIRHRVKDSATLPPDDDPVLAAVSAQPGLSEVRRLHASAAHLSSAKPKTFHREYVPPDKPMPKRQMSLF
jgi:hypothetical protein